MSVPIVRQGEPSPFDAIRRVRADGSEYWSARELMPVMGYSKWEHFETPLNRAMRSAENQGFKLDISFPRSRKVSGTRGPAQNDFELTRFAAYLVAMNGDPNKLEVAAAQAYFAVRTHEAETAKPLTGKDLLAAAVLEAQATIAAKEERIAELAAPARAWNNLAAATGQYSVADAAKILSQDPAISIGRGRLFDFMGEHGWIYRSSNARGGWEAYQHAVDTGRLYERPARPFLNAKTGEYELPAPTIRVTVKGIAKLQELLGGSALTLVEGDAA